MFNLKNVSDWLFAVSHLCHQLLKDTIGYNAADTLKQITLTKIWIEHITTHNPQPVAEQALLRKPIEVEVEVKTYWKLSIYTTVVVNLQNKSNFAQLRYFLWKWSENTRIYLHR